MNKTFLNPETVSETSGNYSHAVEITGKNRQLFISGQIPEKPNGEVPADFEAQCEAVWNNIGAILKAANMSFNDLVKVTTFLTNQDQAATNGAIRRKFLGELNPVLTVVVVQTLESKWLLEIEAIAAAE